VVLGVSILDGNEAMRIGAAMEYDSDTIGFYFGVIGILYE